MMDPELLKQITKDANEAAQRLRAGLSSVAIAQPIMTTPTSQNMPTFQSWIQELNETFKRISEAINRAVTAFMRFFRNIARRLQRTGLITRKPRAHKHRQSTRRMQVYAMRSV
jgi:uncharacterized protein YukE